MNITTNGKIKSGSSKTKKIGDEKFNFYQFKYVCPISEVDFKEFAGNGANTAYNIVPFPFNKIVFDGLKNPVKLKITELDEEGNEEGEEKEFADVVVKKYEFINSANLPTLSVDFLVPTSKNLVEALVNMTGFAKINIR